MWIKVKLKPSDTASNSRIGSLVLDQTPKKNITFDNLAPFFNSKSPIGKATYKGPAATVPSTKAISSPIKPEPWPIYLIKVSLGTQTSISPITIKIGGTNNSISRKFDSVITAAFLPVV